MTGLLSRRAFLGTIGAGLALASASAAWMFRDRDRARMARERERAEQCCPYVDHQAWMVTAADKEKLLARKSVRILDATDFPGGNIADRIATDASACLSWCLSEPGCQSFTYAKPTHPDPAQRNRCWIKSSRDLTAVASPLYTSGIR